jgi:DNA-directed RNA polymerase subunit RPC12/RpoP
MRCPDCGKIFPSNHYKCNTCNKPLVSEEEYRKIKANPNIPKCPTCGSTNIRHISSTERGVNAVMFGFFGNKRKCQFECLNPNCRYRW